MRKKSKILTFILNIILTIFIILNLIILIRNSHMTKELNQYYDSLQLENAE